MPDITLHVADGEITPPIQDGHAAGRVRSGVSADSVAANAFPARFARAVGVRAAMENNRFDTPVTVKAGDSGDSQLLRTVRETSDYLMNSWPGKKSPKHRAALQACHDALAGDKPAMNARRAFIAAAREVNVFISDKAPV
jgi:hypothetical protein